jgi:hypothetical protein
VAGSGKDAERRARDALARVNRRSGDGLVWAVLMKERQLSPGNWRYLV